LSVSKGKLLAFVLVWLMLFGAGAVAWKFLFQPGVDAAKKQEIEEGRRKGSSESRYDYRLNLSLDAFSGYAILRSEEFANELANKSVKINFVDDGADYTKRLADLKNGNSQMAVFTIDALLKTCSQTGDLPASIVAIIDESRGADAIVGYKSKYPNVNALSDPDLRFVLTPDSPSETLARVVMADYDLPDLGENPFIAKDGARDVYDAIRTASDKESKVYVMWEPFVTRATQNSALGVIISTKNVNRYILDVLVVQKEYLDQNEEVVKDIVEAYFTAAFKYQSEAKKLQLVLQDAKELGEPLKESRAKNLVSGIAWKNTQSNYAHFGIHPAKSVSHIEDTIERISKVLMSTSGMSSDPTGGRPNLLYYDAILKELAAADFHPDGRGNLEEDKLRALSDSEWNSLTEVGNMKTDRLAFRPGITELNQRHRAILDDLIDRLRSHRYYLSVYGVGNRRGDAEENKKVASDRAQAAYEYLLEHGIDSARMHTAKPALGSAPTVTFSLGQLPY